MHRSARWVLAAVVILLMANSPAAGADPAPEALRVRHWSHVILHVGDIDASLSWVFPQAHRVGRESADCTIDIHANSEGLQRVDMD